MPRIEPLSIEQLSPSIRLQIEAGQKLLGFVPNDGLTMARKPEISGTFLKFVQAIYAPGKVEGSLKRLIGLMASSAAGCQYCVAHTANSAARLGVEEEKLRAIWEYQTSPLFNAAERAALLISQNAAQVPNAVTDNEYAEFAKYYDEEEQIEIIAVISLFGFLNRWNSTISTDIESSPMQMLKKINQSKGG